MPQLGGSTGVPWFMPATTMVLTTSMPPLLQVFVVKPPLIDDVVGVLGNACSPVNCSAMFSAFFTFTVLSTAPCTTRTRGQSPSWSTALLTRAAHWLCVLLAPGFMQVNAFATPVPQL